ncbi:alpha-hydroxy acid oxidase [Novosphingobium sp. 9]|uniref:alpha-hydroxy acid oxidase n=1 Tax=Novosphingobium sp. 9 TaxID=2025349 RepID=UPI0021B5FC30|nr:alpha-hydroxy acid oxidase [Novosphingobium sp. 9]
MSRAPLPASTSPESRRAGPAGWGTGGLSGRAAALRRRYPAITDLYPLARRRVPRFAYDFVAGGVNDDLCLARNRAALDAVTITPRYGRDVGKVDLSTDLFGQRYALPTGVSPMGLAGLLWPGIDESIAAAAQAARIPYVLSTVANTTIERIARIAPDVFWYQLYNVPGDDHRVLRDLIARAEGAGAKALVLTLDVPVRSKRYRDVRNGLSVPFRLRARTVRDVALAPRWALSMLRHGQPRFHNFDAYLGERAATADIAGYVYREMAGPMTWETVAMIRDLWPRALVVKGVLHPRDAEEAVRLGCEGLLVSNHGGRQFDAAPAAIDALPAIAAAVGDRMTVLMDSGIQSGLDVRRAMARGARAGFAGRAFAMGHAALGREGPAHVIRILEEEIRLALAQSGADAAHYAKP